MQDLIEGMTDRLPDVLVMAITLFHMDWSVILKPTRQSGGSEAP